jgi:hypothetical protein
VTPVVDDPSGCGLTEVSNLVIQVTRALERECKEAHARDDVDLTRFVLGSLGVVESIWVDFSADPRDAPEVCRYLQRVLLDRGRG